MNLAEGYLGRAPPDIVRSVMPNSFSSRSLNSSTDGAQVMGPNEDRMTQPEEHINGVGGTWPRQIQGHSNAKYLDIPLDNSTTFRPSTVPPSPRSRSTRFLSQSMESPLWNDGRPDSARDPPPPTITVQDFSAVPTPAGFSHNAQRASPSERRRPYATTVGAGPLNNKESLRSPLMNDRRYGAASHQGPFYATSYDHPHQMWNNTTGGGGVSAGFRSGTTHAISNGTGGAFAETGTGECYTRVTQQLMMRDSENLPLDQVHPAMSQTRYVPQQSASYETTVKSLKAMLAFPPHGHGSPSTGEGSRNPDNVGYASVNKIPHLWRNHINPVGGVDLSGSGDSRGSDRTSTQGYSSDTNFTVRLADNTSRELRSADGITHLDTAAGERNRHPRPQHYTHDRSFSDDRSVSHGDTSPNDRSFSQDISNTSHDESFSSNRNLAHDRSFSNDDPRGTAAGRRTQLNGASAQVEDQVLHRWMTTFNDTTMTSEPVPKGQGYSSRFINEVLSSRYGRGGNDNQEDLVSSGGLTETEGAKSPATNGGGKAMMGEHRKWIQMEDRLLIRIYELQKERSQLTVKVEELAVENRDLSRRFKDTAGQLERKSMEMETVRRQLRERIVDMTSTISTPQDSTPPSSFHRDAPPSTSSNQRRCHDNDDDVDARRGRQVAQEELAACQIRFARDRERWISEKVKVLRYQQLLQAKYEQVVAENQVLKEQVGMGKELCQNTTAMRSAITQQRLTLLKDGPSGLSFDSVC